MAKICTDDQNLSLPCLLFEGGQCEGDFYSVQMDVDVIRNFGFVDNSQNPPVFVDVFVEQTLRADFSTYFISGNPNPQQLKGKLTCISEAFQTTGGIFVFVYFQIGNNSFNGFARLSVPGQLVGARVTEVINLSTFPNPDNCGNFDYQNITCRCTGGDETITCVSAQGGICCIKKSILDNFCEVLN